MPRDGTLRRRQPGGDKLGSRALNEDRESRESKSEVTVYSPQEISERIGGISVKSLAEVIRKAGLETTTVGYAEPSKRGGPGRRIWGMTDDQLERFLHFRNQRRRGSRTSRESDLLSHGRRDR